MNFLLNEGKERFGNDFRIEKQDIPVINRLLIYAIHEEAQCKKYGIDLNKGILLTGPIGCGKTTWMNLIQTLYLVEDQFPIIPSRDIASKFKHQGFDAIKSYSKLFHTICIDDLGVEPTMKYYGDECNTVAQTLLDRYDLKINQGIVTHATSNLTAAEIEEFYGNRVRSRLRKMFNLLSFPANAKDKRT